MSSIDTPANATSAPNAALIARSSGISATHGTHHVAQMLTMRSLAVRGKTSLIFAGSLTSTSTAAEAVAASRRNAIAISGFISDDGTRAGRRTFLRIMAGTDCADSIGHEKN